MAATATDLAIARRFRDLLQSRGVPVDSAVLFGSRARGQAEWDSDFDVLVVLDRLDPAIRRAVDECAWEVGFDDALVISPVVVTREEVENSPFRSSLLMLAIKAEGIAV